jgi:hypothetical protein
VTLNFHFKEECDCPSHKKTTLNVDLFELSNPLDMGVKPPGAAWRMPYYLEIIGDITTSII